MGWIPGGAKEHGEHEPRNGLTMCKNHHDGFDRYYFFMRYFPEVSLISSLHPYVYWAKY